MSHLPHMFLAAATALLRRRPQPDLPYSPPDPVPEGWLVLETRWDCQTCQGVQPAVVRSDHFRCLTCGVETPTAYV